MSLESTLGIKPSQILAPTKSKGKKVDDCEATSHCRKSMHIARKSNSKTLQVTHYVKTPSKTWKDSKTPEFKRVTSIVEGNIAKHPTNKDLKVVEIIQTYKESITSSDEEIKVLCE